MLPALIMSVGLILGYLLINPSLIRSSKQPVSYSYENEDKFLSFVINNPKFWAESSVISESDFSQSEARKLWSTINDKVKSIGIYPVKEGSSEKIIQKVKEKIPETLFNGEDFKNIPYIEKIVNLNTTLDEAILAGQLIINDSLDRSEYNGSSVINWSNDKFYREIGSATLSRRIWVPIIVSLSLLINYEFAIENYNKNMYLLAFLSLSALTLFSIEWSLVDLDTMYLDMKYFIIGSIISYILGLYTLYGSSSLKNIIPALVVTLSFLVMLEITNFIFRRIKGVNGMGFGDYYILLSTVGLPSMLAGSWLLGYRVIMISLILAVIGWVMGLISGKSGRDKPFAFGPYLALGWIVAILSWILLPGVTLI